MIINQTELNCVDPIDNVMLILRMYSPRLLVQQELGWLWTVGTFYVEICGDDIIHVENRSPRTFLSMSKKDACSIKIIQKLRRQGK